MDWRIRLARLGDLDRLVVLLGELFAIEADFSSDTERQKRGLLLMLDSSQACVLVAEAEGTVIGMATGQLTISTAEGGPALLVEDVVVAKDWRGFGIGRRLLIELGGWATSRNACRLQLLADRNNVAGLDFYRKLGWRSTELICLRQRANSSDRG